MEFRRYEGFLNTAPQKKIDNELPLCPFCGEYPHWNLNIRSGITTRITCMCERCQGKLTAEYTMALDMDDLRVVDIGTRNIHNLTLNATYHIMALNSLAQSSKIYSAENNFFKQDPIPNIIHNSKNNITATKKRTGVIIGLVSFFVALCISLLVLIPGNVTSPTSNQLEPVQQSSMSVEEILGSYYVTITGSAKNTSKRTMDYVSITFTLYDSAGNVVGTALDNQLNLGAGETWIYSASGTSTTNKPVSWKSTDVTVICY